MSTILRANAFTFTQLGVLTKQECLLASFRATLHPLSLANKFESIGVTIYLDELSFFFNFDDLFSAILRKKYA